MGKQNKRKHSEITHKGQNKEKTINKKTKLETIKNDHTKVKNSFKNAKPMQQTPEDFENEDVSTNEEVSDTCEIEERLYQDESDGEVTFKDKKQIFDSEGEEEEGGEEEEEESGEEEEGSEEENEEENDGIIDIQRNESEPGDAEIDKSLTHLADDDELVTEAATIDYPQIKNRIQDTIQILTDKDLLSKAEHSRSDYLAILSTDIRTYYGYNEDLTVFLMKLFEPGELFQFLEAMETERPVVIRTNTLKTRRKTLAQALIQRGVNCDPVGDWSKVGLIIYDTPISIGATPEYLAGHYMLQSAASFLPVLALQPQENERILDMCSAPGGKTTYISQLMKNTGTVVANDLKLERLKATVANVSRLGVKNCIVVNHSGTDFPKLMGGFDRVLLDAPCSGLGVISRDSTIKATRTEKDLIRNSVLQKRLILSAIDSVDCNSKTGGIIIYSTCSISVLENEMVVNYALRKRFVKLVETGLPFGAQGLSKYQTFKFHPSLILTRRFYPHVHNTDGFYVAKLKKYANGPKDTVDDDEKEKIVTEGQQESEVPIVDSLFAEKSKELKKGGTKLRKREKMLLKQKKNNDKDAQKHKSHKKKPKMMKILPNTV